MLVRWAKVSVCEIKFINKQSHVTLHLHKMERVRFHGRIGYCRGFSLEYGAAGQSSCRQNEALRRRSVSLDARSVLLSSTRRPTPDGIVLDTQVQPKYAVTAREVCNRGGKNIFQCHS